MRSNLLASETYSRFRGWKNLICLSDAFRCFYFPSFYWHENFRFFHEFFVWQFWLPSVCSVLISTVTKVQALPRSKRTFKFFGWINFTWKGVLELKFLDFKGSKLKIFVYILLNCLVIRQTQLHLGVNGLH
jgi:hypothetical protein